MPTTIDQLQIEVETKSEKANQGLNKLKSTLQSLNKVAQASGLDVTCKRLERIASLDFSNLSALSKLSKATKPLQDVSSKIKNVTDVAAKVPKDIGLSIDISGISDVMTEIQSTTSAIEEMPHEIAAVVQTPGANEAVATLDSIQSSLEGIPNRIVTTVQTPGIGEAETALAGIESTLANIPEMKNLVVQATVQTQGIPGATGEIYADAISVEGDLSFTQKLLNLIWAKAQAAGDSIENLRARFRAFGASASAAAKKAASGIKKIWAYTKELGKSGWVSLKKFGAGISQILRIVLIYGGAFRAFQLFTEGISEGLENISKYSNETATSMNKLSTMSLYLKNSIGAALYPVIVSVTPALESMTNAIVKALNSFNQFVAAWGGAATFIKAKKYLKEYGDTAKKTANQIRRSFAGIDEITVIGNKDNGSSDDTPDYSQMFETAPISPKVSSIVENLKKNLDNIKLILGGAALAVGAILTFSGADVPLGIGLMAVGGTLLGSAVKENWNHTSGNLKDNLDNIMLIISGAMIVIGALLAFSGVSVPLGIALMIGGAASLGTAVALNWEGMPQNIKNVITTIGIALGAALLIVGVVLAFSGHIPLGIGLMIAGAAELGTAVTLGWEVLPQNIKNIITEIGIALGAALLAVGVILAFSNPTAAPLGIGLMIAGAVTLGYAVTLGWDTLPQRVKNVLSIILAAVSGLSLVIGIILCATSVGIPLGIALIALGAAGLATAAAINWDWVKDKVKTVLASLLSIVSVATLVLGVVLCLSGAGIPIGLALIAAGAKGINKAAEWDDNAVTSKVKGSLDKIKSTISGWWDKLKRWWSGLSLSQLHFKMPHFTWTSKPADGWIAKVLSALSLPTSLPKLNVSWYANGGFPAAGEMFVAREAGPEMVGTIGNRTAVANNDQIVQSIQGGVYAANQEQNALLREQNDLLRKLLEKDETVHAIVTTSDIEQGLLRKNRRNGLTTVPVG